MWFLTAPYCSGEGGASDRSRLCDVWLRARCGGRRRFLPQENSGDAAIRCPKRACAKQYMQHGSASLSTNSINRAIDWIQYKGMPPDQRQAPAAAPGRFCPDSVPKPGQAARGSAGVQYFQKKRSSIWPVALRYLSCLSRVKGRAWKVDSSILMRWYTSCSCCAPLRASQAH